MHGPHLEQIARLYLIRHRVKPVAVGEAQENLRGLADAALEVADRLGKADIESIERNHEPVRKHQQRRLVEMRDQAQQKILMPELSEHAVLGIDEEWIGGVADYGERMAIAHEARAGARVYMLVFPVPVVAIAILEILQKALGARQRVRLARTHHQRETHQIAAGEPADIVEREVAQRWHVLRLDLA